MGYEYDVFLSYKRHAEAKEWVVDHFQPILELYLELELGQKPRVFRDENLIEVGSTWPAELGRALGRSRSLVALWSRAYFHSDWCSRELSTMLARESEAQLRTAANPSGLIVPVVLHDCEVLPAGVGSIQSIHVRECFNVRMRRDSALAEKLTGLIRDQIAPGVASAIGAAPPWRETWPEAAASTFLAAVRRPEPPRQATVPRFA